MKIGNLRTTISIFAILLMIVVIGSVWYGDSSASTLQNKLIVGGLFAIAVVVLISFLMVQLIGKPIYEISETLDSIADGDLETEIGNSSISEFETIATSIQKIKDQLEENSVQLIDQQTGFQRFADQMTRELNKLANGDFTAYLTPNGEINGIFQNFNTAVSNVRGIIEGIVETSANVTKVATEIRSSMLELSANSHEQSNQIHGVADAIDQMNQTISSNSDNAYRTAEAANESGSVAEDGGNIVLQTTERIQVMADVMAKSTDTVERLGKSSGEIGKIISVIDDIADQTNLLALNAAIEAARAGDQGRGFAVVADEVRKLAERTTQATKQITDMIIGIQAETELAIEAMQNGRNEVNEGIELAGHARGALNNIVLKVQVVAELVDQIASASEEQSATSNEVSSNIDLITSKITDSAESANNVTNSVEELHRLTTELNQLIGQFQFGNSQIAEVERSIALR